MQTETTFGPHVSDTNERQLHKQNIRKALAEKITPFEKLILDNLDFSRGIKNTAK